MNTITSLAVAAATMPEAVFASVVFVVFGAIVIAIIAKF